MAEEWSGNARYGHPAWGLSSSLRNCAIRDKNPKSKMILKKLEEPISMSFATRRPSKMS